MPIYTSLMVGSISATNSSNFINVKLVNILNNFVVARIIASTFQTPIRIHLLTCTLASSNSLAFDMWNELAPTCKSTLPLPIHVHKQLFQDLVITRGRRARTISHRTRTMTWRWGHDLQVKIPFHKWNEKK